MAPLTVSRSVLVNLERVKEVKEGWGGGAGDRAATADFLAVLRSGTPDDACGKVVELLNRGVGLAALWDGVLGGASELLMRQPGLVGIHCVTSANALRYAGDRSFAEIAIILDCDEGAARVRFHRAKALLRRHLRAGSDGPDFPRAQSVGDVPHA